jgi:hypothetical protein
MVNVAQGPKCVFPCGTAKLRFPFSIAELIKTAAIVVKGKYPSTAAKFLAATRILAQNIIIFFLF